MNIFEIICKLERIFPPSFFHSMEHWTIHLPYEAKVEGPVQYRWMYLFERYGFMSYYFLFVSIFSQTNWYQWYRYMFYLKKKVTNKAKVEGSIYEAYLIDEITNFASYYFGDDMQTIWNQVPRNDENLQEIIG